MNKGIGKYKYLDREDTTKLVIGKIYDRIEPENELRIIDEKFILTFLSTNQYDFLSK